MRWCVCKNAAELVQALSKRTGSDGHDTRDEGAATNHREVDSREILHRHRLTSGRSLAIGYVFFHAIISFIVASLHETESVNTECCTFATSEKRSEGVEDR